MDGVGGVVLPLKKLDPEANCHVGCPIQNIDHILHVVRRRPKEKGRLDFVAQSPIHEKQES